MTVGAAFATAGRVFVSGSESDEEEDEEEDSEEDAARLLRFLIRFLGAASLGGISEG